MNAFALGVSALALAGAAYRLVTASWIRSWLGENVPRSRLLSNPPVTYLRPIKRGVPGLREKLETHLAALREGDELIVGLDPGDGHQLSICDGLAAHHERLRVVRCPPGLAANPKISKLLSMAPLARRDRWILCDSELLIDEEFATLLNAEWSASGADAITCAYRFIGAESWPQQLDAAASYLTLWPGLAVLRRTGGGHVRLAMGACTGVKAADIDLAALGDELAEDFHLGARLAVSGRKVRLSSHLARLESDTLTWNDYWLHQQRVAVTYRACNPVGFAFQVLVQPALWSVLAVLSGGCGGLLTAVLVWILCVVAARLSLRDKDMPTWRLAGIVFAAAFVETACWGLSWLSDKIWWGGAWRTISWRGKLNDKNFNAVS